MEERRWVLALHAVVRPRALLTLRSLGLQVFVGLDNFVTARCRVRQTAAHA